MKIGQHGLARWDAVSVVRWSVSLLLVWLLLAACRPETPVDPVAAQLTAQTAWHRAWRGTWSLTWPAAPLPEALVFAAWQTESGLQRRYEILEAGTPGLVGQVYVNDGRQAAHYNRFLPDRPATLGSAALPFSPISSAFETISSYLATPPEAAHQERIDLPQGPGRKLTLFYPQEQVLTLWLAEDDNLIVRVELVGSDTELTLVARTLTPLTDPHPRLFAVE